MSQSSNKRIAKNTIFLYIRMLFVMIITLYTTKVVLKVLGVVDYGIYNVVCGFVSLFAFLNTSLTTGTNRFYNYAIGKNDKQQETDVYNASLRIQIIILFCAIVISESIGLWYLYNKMVIPVDRLSTAFWIFQFSVISLCLLILQIPYSAAVIAHEKMNFYAVVSIIDAAMKLVFVVLLQYVQYDKLLFYGFLMLVTSATNFIFNWVYSMFKFENIRLDRRVNKEIFRGLFSFSLWSLLDPITVTCRGQGCNMVLNACFGPVVNAAYGISNQISGAIDGFTNNLSIAFRPQIIQSYSSGEYSRTKALFYSMSRINYMLHLMLIIPVAFSISYILDLWLGSYPSETRIFTICVMIMQTINCLHAPISTVMVATGKIKKIKIVSFIIICSVIPLSVLLFSFGFSVYTIYYLLLVLSAINVWASVKILCQTFPTINPAEYFKDIFIPLLIYTVTVVFIPVVIYLLLGETLLSTILQCIITLFSALTSGYVIVLNQREKQYFKTIVSKFLHK